MSESSHTGDGPASVPASVTPAKQIRPPTPHSCRNFIRRKTAEAMPRIVETFVGKAIGGSVPHFTSLARVGGFDQKPAPPTPPQRRGRSLARRMLDEVERYEARVAAENAAAVKAAPGEAARAPEES